MIEKPDEALTSLQETQTRLREGLDSAKRLVERTKFLLRGEADGRTDLITPG